jgi:hypothetical protein
VEVKECQKLCKDMLNNDKGYLMREIGRLFKSGGVDTNNYSINNMPFTLPRILLKTALHNYADAIMLVDTKRDNKIINNLKNF